jgi:hypothetical protein
MNQALCAHMNNKRKMKKKSMWSEKQCLDYSFRFASPSVRLGNLLNLSGLFFLYLKEGKNNMSID